MQSWPVARWPGGHPQAEDFLSQSHQLVSAGRWDGELGDTPHRTFFTSFSILDNARET